MSFNGAGVFNINTSGQPVAAGTVIDPTVFNTLMTDIATGLSNCVTKDGQQTVTANIPMNSNKITGLGLGTSSTDAARVDNANSRICEFRMTLTTGVPVTTSDVTVATTLYVTPYKGNNIALYDGTNWHMRSSSEMSIAIPSNASTMHDLFCYDNSGTPTLEALAWTNDTTRATALVLQDGVLVKSGATTRRYLGSFRTTGVSGNTEDSAAKRYVWNYYNRCVRPMRVFESTATWTYTTAVVRQANGSTANQLDFVIGYSEDLVLAELEVTLSNSSAGVGTYSGIGLDSTTAASAQSSGGQVFTTGADYECRNHASYRGFPGVGRHFLAWLELSAATGTTTWYSGVGAHGDKNGIHGQILG